jgi:hypothetical protein
VTSGRHPAWHSIRQPRRREEVRDSRRTPVLTAPVKTFDRKNLYPGFKIFFSVFIEI